MKKQWIPRLSVMLLAVLLIGFPAAGQKNNEADVLLQAAAQKATVEGDLQEAIRLCRQILAEYPDNRPVAARALLQMGQCYEKLGNDEARRAYERLVRDYADQSEPANAARARLAALAGPGPTTLTTRRLENPPEDVHFLGAISPDGRYLSFRAGRTGDLAVHDLQTGNDRRLTNGSTSGNAGSSISQECGASTWSSDSKQIAYAWYIYSMDSLPSVPNAEVRIVGIDGGKPRVLVKLDNIRELAGLTWSPDGKQIAASAFFMTGQDQIMLISATDGATRVLAEFKRSIFPINKRFSPDGRYLAYECIPDDMSPERDIFLMSIDTGKATPLVQHPADDYLLGWSRDGKWIVFASDRTGTLGLWIVGMSGARVQGEPRLARPGIDKIMPIGLTSEGALYYGVVRATEDVYIADLDANTGMVAGPAKNAIEQFEGSNSTAAYSHDGKYLAYVSGRGNSGHALCIRSLDTGQERVFYRELWRLGLRGIDGQPEWSPDGRFIIFTANEGSARRRAACRLDLQTGLISLILNCSPDEGISGILFGPDNKYILARSDMKQGFAQIVARDIESGAERELYRFPKLDIINIALSPDSRSLSFVNLGWSGVRSLRIMPASGGDSREVWSFGEVKMSSPDVSHVWAPDGRYILFSAPDPANMRSWDLWRMPVAGGKPEKIGLQRTWGIWSLTLRPDGRQLAFTGRGGPSDEAELWVMENFLPK
jgi:Tol biopolymer transport system component